MKKLHVIIVLLVFFSCLSAQVSMGSTGANFIPDNWNWSPDSWSWNPSSYSLLNPNNYTMGHTMSFSTGYSGGTSAYQSTYTNHFSYQVNDKLDINMDLHFTNFGSANINKGLEIESNGDNTSDIIPDFSLEYRPTDNTTINFVYKGGYLPGQYNRFYDWRD